MATTTAATRIWKSIMTPFCNRPQLIYRGRWNELMHRWWCVWGGGHSFEEVDIRLRRWIFVWGIGYSFEEVDIRSEFLLLTVMNRRFTTADRRRNSTYIWWRGFSFTREVRSTHACETIVHSLVSSTRCHWVKVLTCYFRNSINSKNRFILYSDGIYIISYHFFQYSGMWVQWCSVRWVMFMHQIRN